MTAAVVEREIRRVKVGSTLVPLGALAGTTTGHPFVPDDWSGTSCQLCYGWSDDSRHFGRRPAVWS